MSFDSEKGNYFPHSNKIDNDLLDNFESKVSQYRNSLL